MPHKPSPRERLTRAGLSAAFADLVLTEHAHAVAQHIRWTLDHKDPRMTASEAADLIDPKAQP